MTLGLLQRLVWGPKRGPRLAHEMSKRECVVLGHLLGAQQALVEVDRASAQHANCVGCVKGGRAYWLKVLEHHPDVFAQRAAMEEEFGHEIIRGGDREHVTLQQLAARGLQREVRPREAIEIGACDCGD